ncbi:MAG TPA: RNA-guided pseudouridylation complex pseudouridine synthase subunit Cbf5 [Candidatus Nanoarchaeia archaeon]|nr:RNA-guided pseudouridylation complex pseudouridine synthase subunit Cbf5 [Candidatus Nanoarchaeia archaeon]
MDLEKLKQQKSLKELMEFGIINIDKPSGPTSFDVSEHVMKKLGLRKTSHFGTLDPKVTGVLPVALNRACKLTGYFLGEDKVYVGIMRLHEEISIEKLKEVIKEKFLGVIKQTPPVKSRVARVEREREIKSFEILEQDGKDFLFKTHVQGGTYIRKLCDDLGKELGIGAHMLELRRVKAGIFEEDGKEYASINLYDFDKTVDEFKKGNEKPLRDIIIPGETITKLHPIVEIDKECVERVLRGQPIYEKNLSKKVKEKYEEEKIVCVFSKDRFIGMFKIMNKDNVFAKSEFTMQEIK